MTQQARNLSWELAEEGTQVATMIHDRDRKFARGLDVVCEAEGARVVLTPLMAPRANAHAERWVGSARGECMDWMLIVGHKHLEAVLGEYVEHYNTERRHQSRGLEPPAGGKPPVGRGRVVLRQRFGGLIHEYRRELQAAGRDKCTAHLTSAKSTVTSCSPDWSRSAARGFGGLGCPVHLGSEESLGARGEARPPRPETIPGPVERNYEAAVRRRTP